MRRFRAIAYTTALELLSEPLCMLVTLSAVALAILAPTFHCHQFGEPSRMARDAGFSCLLTGGVLYVAFGAVRTFRREAESGTLQGILAHPVSHATYFLAKTSGCLVAYAVFALTLGGIVLTVVNGFEVGGRIAALSGDIVRIWRPSLALGLTVLIVPIVVSAALNRFSHRRFTLWTSILMLVLALPGPLLRPDFALYARIIPVLVLFALPALVVLAASAAFSARFPSNVSAAGLVVASLLFLPALGNYCLSDALANARSVPLSYFWTACLAIVPAVAFFLALGVALVHGRDVA